MLFRLSICLCFRSRADRLASECDEGNGESLASRLRAFVVADDGESTDEDEDDDDAEELTEVCDDDEAGEDGTKKSWRLVTKVL